MRRRLVLPAIAAVVAVPALAACNPEHAGAAATVGDHRISEGDLAKNVQAGYAAYTPTSGTTKDLLTYQRDVLGRAIQTQVDRELAKELGVHVTEADIQEQTTALVQRIGTTKDLYTEAAQEGISRGELHDVILDRLLRAGISSKLLSERPPTDENIQQFYEANQSQFGSDHVAHILVTSKQLADRIYADVKAHPDKFAADAKQFSIDTSNKDNGGDLGEQQRGAFVQEFEDAIFAAQAGEIIGPVQTQFGYHIIKIITLSQETLAQAHDAILNQLEQPDSTYAGQLYASRATAIARKLGVHVSSRFGTWDSSQGAVTAPGADPKTALSVLGPQAATPSSTNDLSSLLSGAGSGSSSSTDGTGTTTAPGTTDGSTTDGSTTGAAPDGSTTGDTTTVPDSGSGSTDTSPAP